MDNISYMITYPVGFWIVLVTGTGWIMALDCTGTGCLHTRTTATHTPAYTHGYTPPYIPPRWNPGPGLTRTTRMSAHPTTSPFYSPFSCQRPANERPQDIHPPYIPPFGQTFQCPLLRQHPLISPLAGLTICHTTDTRKKLLTRLLFRHGTCMGTEYTQIQTHYDKHSQMV